MKVRIKKSRTGPEDLTEYVVRVECRYGDFAVCGCPGKWEAELVKQCLAEALMSKSPSAKLRKMIDEIEKDFGAIDWKTEKK